MHASKNIRKLIFAETLDYLRKREEWNQERVAQIAGVSQGAVSGWSNGALPRADALYRLSRAFGVTMEYLLTGEEPNTGMVMEPPPAPDTAGIAQQLKVAREALAVAEAELKKIGR